MEGITLEDVYLMVKYDIGAGNENPERHIEKYVKRMCKEQRALCDTYATEYQAEHDFWPVLDDAPEPNF